MKRGTAAHVYGRNYAPAIASELAYTVPRGGRPDTTRFVSVLLEDAFTAGQRHTQRWALPLALIGGVLVGGLCTDILRVALVLAVRP
jgi:hypothetical protein